MTTRVSVGPGGVEANAYSGALSISGDGNHVAFDSAASNLVTGDTNNASDVFVHDVQTGLTERVSVDSAGNQGLNGVNYYPAISFDGRFVAFHSNATNLVSGDNNACLDVFVRDRQLGQTTLASLDSTGAQANSESANIDDAISDDGRYVTFQSMATNLVAGDTNGSWDIFVRDRQTGTTVRASVSTTSAEADGNSFNSAISADGRYVVFRSIATNLVSGDNNFRMDVFVRDLVTGQTTRASVDTAGVEGNGNSSAYPAISANGRWVAFDSDASNLVSGDTNAFQDVFVRDLQAAVTTRVSINSHGVQSNSVSWWPTITADGRYVAFGSDGSRLVPSDTNHTFDVFVRDHLVGQTVRISVSSSGGQGNGESNLPSISADGRRVAFLSYANNLVSGDTNGQPDVFLRDLGPGPTTYCTSGTTTNGCTPSISSAGTPSASIGSGFLVSVSAVEGQKLGMIFYGLNNSGFAPLAWSGSSSWLCVKAPTQRTGAQSSGGTSNACDGAIAIAWNTFVSAHPNALGQPIAAGQHVYMQGWFRDPPSPKTTMLSNALGFVLEP